MKRRVGGRVFDGTGALAVCRDPRRASHAAAADPRCRAGWRRATRIALAALVGATLVAAPARADFIDSLRGHLAIGYSKLMIQNASANDVEVPGGSFSTAAGFDLPVGSDLRLGLGLGFNLLGSTTVARGSFVASVDYTVFDIDLMLHWLPRSLGPVERISLGPALVSAKADLSASAGGAGFSDLAVNEVVPGVALDATLMSHSAALVRVGLELGSRYAFLTEEDWFMASARVAIHY